MKAFKCDKCGKFYEKKPGLERCLDNMNGSDVLGDEWNYNLCPDCTNTILTWIKEPLKYIPKSKSELIGSLELLQRAIHSKHTTYYENETFILKYYEEGTEIFFIIYCDKLFQEIYDFINNKR
jgi:hypothetical protein